jgi:hypothetical protein
MKKRFYLLRVQLLEIEPPIWRLFTVPADITLDRLHDVIQIVMGWSDSHLYEITIEEKRYMENPEPGEDGAASGKYRLGELIKRKGEKFHYVYDFGDNWEHELVLENSRFSSQDQDAELACLEGERACPPEDVGGAPGYLEFLKALNDPNHEDHQSYIEWSGGDYVPDSFDVDVVNWELMQYRRWSRDRDQKWENNA